MMKVENHYQMTRFHFMDIENLLEVVKIYFPDKIKENTEKEILSLSVKKARRAMIKIIKKSIGKHTSINAMVEDRFLANRPAYNLKRPYSENELDYCMKHFQCKLPDFITLN